MKVRKITQKERYAINDLRRYAFTSWSDKEVKEDDLTGIVPDETLGLFDNGRLLASVAWGHYRQSIRGILKDMGGIEGVASYPEARDKGYIRQLTIAAFQNMRENGQSVSMLYPFKESFYAQFGFTKASAPSYVKAPIKSFQYALKTKLGTNWTVERIRAVDVKDDFLKFRSEIGPPQYHGFLVFVNIPDSHWKKRVKDSIVVFLKHKDEIQATARYRIKGKEEDGRWRSEMSVVELYWRSREARDKLFNFFAKHRDQIEIIWINAPFELGVEHWFQDIELDVRRGAPAMVRVIDVKSAVEGLPATGEDMLTLEITDPECDWNNGVFALQSEKNQLRMKESSGKPSVKMTIKAFSALVYGTLPLEELEYREEVVTSESWVQHTLQRWFPIIPFYNNVDF